MQNLMILVLVAAFAWVGWDLYQDGHFDTPTYLVGFANYGLGLGVATGVGERLGNIGLNFGN